MPSELAFFRPPKAAYAMGQSLEVPGHRESRRVAGQRRVRQEHLQERSDAGRPELVQLPEHEGAEQRPPDRAHSDRARRGAPGAPTDQTFASRQVRFHVDGAFIRPTKAATSARGA
jgi:hypothetical protein